MMILVWGVVIIALLLWNVGNKRAGRVKAQTRSLRRKRSDSVVFGIDNVFGTVTLIGILLGVLMLLGVIPFDVGTRLIGGGR